MRLIDADKLIEFIDKGKYCNPNALTFSENAVCEMIDEQPTVAGQCKDCKSADFYHNSDLLYCLEHSCVMESDGFCNCFQREVE